MMTTKEIAEATVRLNREGNHGEAYATLYSPDAVSVETWGGESTSFSGMEAIQKKAQDWEANVVEMHSVTVGEPVVADSSFALTYTMDITYTDRGREQMTELAVYTVKDGKIVREEFQA
jgi:ketosteroid isomerase-like protein